jgi:hypothetical protein
MIATAILRPRARNATPNAAVDFPLPSPVLTITRPLRCFFARTF